MANTSRSPEDLPLSPEMIPPGLEATYEKRNHAWEQSMRLKKAFEELSKQVEEKAEPSREANDALANLGIKLATQEQKEILLDMEIAKAKQASGLTDPRAAEKRLRQLSQRHISCGYDLRRYQQKRRRLGEVEKVLPTGVCGDLIPEGLMALYGKSDPVKTKQPRTWREKAMRFYASRRCDHPEETPNHKSDLVWCHVTGKWWVDVYVKAAHIIPFFLDMESIGSIGNILFGSQVESLDGPGNSLLLSHQIKSWFDTHHLVIVPSDPTEMPTKRWRTDIISPDIKNAVYFTGCHNSDFDGKDLVFLNDNRPVSRWMYFHFIMALVRIKDVNRPGWQDAWAKYYQQRPFPTPAPYMRGRMLLALATHFGSADLRIVDSWIKDNGFDTPMKMLDEEATEAARRVHAAAETAHRLSELRWNCGANSSDEDGPDEDDLEEDDSDEDISERMAWNRLF